MSPVPCFGPPLTFFRMDKGMNGFFTLERKLTQHWCASDPNFLATWIWLLNDANWQDKKNLVNSQLVEIKRGQLIFGREAFSKKSGVSVSKLRRIMELLEKDGMIDQQKTNRYTIVTIKNYSQYQDVDQPTANRTPTEHQQTTTPKQVKQTKQLNKDIYTEKFFSFWEAFPKRHGSNPKSPAMNKFITLCKNGVDPDMMIASAKMYGDERRKENDPKFTCQAIVYLNQARYDGQDGKVRSQTELDTMEAFKTPHHDRTPEQWGLCFPNGITEMTIRMWRTDIHGPKPTLDELKRRVA